VYRIQEYETERRHATMVAILVDTAATITDDTSAPLKSATAVIVSSLE